MAHAGWGSRSKSAECVIKSSWGGVDVRREWACECSASARAPVAAIGSSQSQDSGYRQSEEPDDPASSGTRGGRVPDGRRVDDRGHGHAASTSRWSGHPRRPTSPNEEWSAAATQRRSVIGPGCPSAVSCQAGVPVVALAWVTSSWCCGPSLGRRGSGRRVVGRRPGGEPSRVLASAGSAGLSGSGPGHARHVRSRWYRGGHPAGACAFGGSARGRGGGLAPGLVEVVGIAVETFAGLSGTTNIAVTAPLILWAVSGLGLGHRPSGDGVGVSLYLVSQEQEAAEAEEVTICPRRRVRSRGAVASVSLRGSARCSS